MELVTKEVFYYKYCEQCKHFSKSENEEPCEECLMNSVKEYSHKPIKFEPKENK